MRAVVFAYHNVGVRCIKVLLAGGVDIALVVTHEDNPQENLWFESVAGLCRTEGIIPALESSHAVAHAMKLAKTMRPDQSILVNLSGRGDKDIGTVADLSGDDVYDRPSMRGHVVKGA